MSLNCKLIPVQYWVYENFCLVAVELALQVDFFYFQYNIRSYPTTILYNNSIPHQFTGHHTAADLVEFIEVNER